MTLHALVVDDEAGVRYTIAEILRQAGLEVVTAENGTEALALARQSSFDLVISDLRMAPMDGLELLRLLRAEQPELRVILVTAHGSERLAVEAMRLGAYDYFKKPFELDELMAVVNRALEAVRLTRENEQLRGESALGQSLVFASPAMSRLAGLVRRVAPRAVTVLLTGESGTGKERVAEAIVRMSDRSARPFIRFNCAALGGELAEAELFGHTRGAFTGAQRARNGLFREANTGTLLLDEIGELELATQAKLLRVLQEGEVRPLGEDRPFAVDVRIIAATHRDLLRLVAEGHFREDLYYRLRVVELVVPPLRERPEDIPVLTRHFLRRYAERFGIGSLRAPPDLAARLAARPWPGNVRELENAIEALVALSANGELDLGLLPRDPNAPAAPSLVGATENDEDGRATLVDSGELDGDGHLTLRQRVEAYERGLIVRALEAAQGGRREAARRLGLSRATLHDKLHKYGLVAGNDEE
ncbi:MAG: sigma-54-dependent Fis family transcriptional regulator [Polyangiaceae bacterium]|nr:sigma-54-dependent Fis family transcriptional regulator [Polyangiaceae bacterium]